MLLVIYDTGTKKFVMRAIHQNITKKNKVKHKISIIVIIKLFMILLIFLISMNMTPLLMIY